MPINQVQQCVIEIYRRRFQFLTAWFLITLVIFLVAACDEEDESQHDEQQVAIVASYNPMARKAGLDILRQGGSAADAFVATTFVEYVVAPGVTSMAGPLGALAYDASSGDVFFLDAGLDTFSDPKGLWDPLTPTAGTAAMVPGAVRGLEAVWQKLGKLPWADVIEPARRLAAEGFVIDDFYAYMINAFASVLQRTPYGQQTFFPGGEALTAGSVLVQPELADLLAALQEGGADAMYGGSFAQDFADTVNAAGGSASVADLNGYSAAWTDPWTVNFHDSTVYACSGRTFGGLAVLLGLEVLEYGNAHSLPGDSTDVYERRIRTARRLWQETWLTSPDALSDPAFVADKLDEPHIATIWDDVQDQLALTSARTSGSHSFHVIVVDQEGNAVTGTNTILGEIWGEGLFVQGVPLTAAGKLTAYIPGPGERMVSPLSMHIALRDGQLFLAAGAFNYSLLEAELQFLLHVLDDGLDADEAISKPRFGSFPFDVTIPGSTPDATMNWIDANFPNNTRTELESRGLRFTVGDTGLGGIVLRELDGTVSGATVDDPNLDDGVATLSE